MVTQTPNIKGKNVLITGGTGSFGRHIVKRLLTMGTASITVFSRDEEKQRQMEEEFEEYLSLIKFVLGDVRDYDRILDASRGIQVIYHAAAIKQVPRCEYHPMEAVKTNILGASNVKTAAIANNVERVIAISTDKAVKPVNVMGMTKAIQERIMVSDSSGKGGTKFVCVRYGNVIGSRGSVIPFFKERILQGKNVPVTHPEMTRFLLTLDDAIDLVLKATDADDGHILVKKAPSCKIVDLANAMIKELGGKGKIVYTGMRPGEKTHEVLVSEDEMNRIVESEDYYDIAPYRKMDPGKTGQVLEYTSANTRLLDGTGIKALLQKTGWLPK
ncbi:MAG: SDR family NAD(P)-dependent oxidoreductase [Candidatus Aenigmarchaeota archaeon]|nr:SDR family NAD(P)-dependent oxidoreductase [Candidatus Aenigmarchaeota archaeon]